jgi:hypothetical protein
MSPVCFQSVFDQITGMCLSADETRRSPTDAWHRRWRILTASAFLFFRMENHPSNYPAAE